MMKIGTERALQAPRRPLWPEDVQLWPSQTFIKMTHFTTTPKTLHCRVNLEGRALCREIPTKSKYFSYSTDSGSNKITANNLAISEICCGCRYLKIPIH